MGFPFYQIIWIKRDRSRLRLHFIHGVQASLADVVSPLLILTGEKDTWTRASFCEDHLPSEKPKNEIILKLIPNATHAFDVEDAR